MNRHRLIESAFRFDLIILRRQPWCHFAHTVSDP